MVLSGHGDYDQGSKALQNPDARVDFDMTLLLIVNGCLLFELAVRTLGNPTISHAPWGDACSQKLCSKPSVLVSQENKELGWHDSWRCVGTGVGRQPLQTQEPGQASVTNKVTYSLSPSSSQLCPTAHLCPIRSTGLIRLVSLLFPSAVL